MSLNDNILSLSLGDLRAALDAGKVSGREVVTASLERARALNDTVNAFTELRDDAAERVADEGPLAGVPVAVKDMLVDEDRPPTCGSRAGGHWMRGTAEVCRRLRAAGATVIGYTNLHEWGVGTTSAITATGPIRNPWDLELCPGGSSGGSAAALAAGIVPLALGTDAGCSIRIPAAYCGVTGLKPTFGRVPTEGFVNDGLMIDHIGPLARSVDDVAALFGVLVEGPVSLPDAAGLQLGIARRHFFEDLDPAIAETTEGALETLEGLVAGVTDVDVAGVENANYAIALILLPVAARALEQDLRERPDAFRPETLNVLALGATMGTEELQQGEAARRASVAAWDEAFAEVDVIVTPTASAPPPTIAEQTVTLPSGSHHADTANIAMNGPMNLGGVPALSLPCCELSSGMTASVTLSAARGNDEAVLAVGRALEQALDGAYANRIAPL